MTAAGRGVCRARLPPAQAMSVRSSTAGCKRSRNYALGDSRRKRATGQRTRSMAPSSMSHTRSTCEAVPRCADVGSGPTHTSDLRQPRHEDRACLDEDIEPGDVATTSMTCLAARRGRPVETFSEVHRLWLAPAAKLIAAFDAAGFDTELEPGGLTGRGLLVGVRRYRDVTAVEADPAARSRDHNLVRIAGARIDGDEPELEPQPLDEGRRVLRIGHRRYNPVSASCGSARCRCRTRRRSSWAGARSGRDPTGSRR